MDLQHVPLPDANLRYAESWIGPETATKMMAGLKQELDWKQREIMLFGKTHSVPRLTAWHGDPGVSYRYSGITHEADGWSPVLLDILGHLERCLGLRFNSVLANRYRDGNDSMGWHSDDEPELGACPTIASVSFGQQRRLRFRHRKRKLSSHVDLTHGSLLVMTGDTQEYWQHAIPKSARAMGERVNLTFRVIVGDNGPSCRKILAQSAA